MPAGLRSPPPAPSATQVQPKEGTDMVELVPRLVEVGGGKAKAKK